MPKILHICSSDLVGGASRATFRLHKSLLSAGIDSLLIVKCKSSDEKSIIGPKSQLYKLLYKVLPYLDQILVKFYKYRKRTLFSTSFPATPRFIANTIKIIDPDIVHLHWICGGTLNVKEIKKIKQPIVWTLHDMWPFTGGCHYTENCQKFRNSCGRCNILNSKSIFDLSKIVYFSKRNAYNKKKDITIVGVSSWISEMSKSSTLLSSKNNICIPNPLDCGVYKPFNKIESRELWNLPKDKKLILFGAISAINDLRKGARELFDAIEKINSDECELVIFGCSAPNKDNITSISTNYVGFINDDVSLVTLYSACDVMVVPSLQEAFGQTASEAMSCGTPVVAFNTTGLKDIIDHKKNGYLATPFNPEDLACGIQWVLNQPKEQYTQLQKNSIQKVHDFFDANVVAKQYIQLYKEICSKQA
jgi:glycosyltransferase involved in cell wall biosynthesis